MRNFKVTAGWLACLVLSGCSIDETSLARVRLTLWAEPPVPRLAFPLRSFREVPSGALEHDCYALSIAASDLPSDLPSSLPYGLTRSCLDLGRMSDVATGGGSSVEMSLTVPTGDGRHIRLLGLNGAACEVRMEDMLLPLAPRVHVLGEATQAILGDTTIHLPDAYSSNSPRELLAPCAEAPAVSQVVPSSGPASGGFTVTLSGTGFLPDPEIRVNDAACSPVRVVSSTEASCQAPPGVPLTTVDVVFSNRGPKSTLHPNALTYTSPTFDDWTPMDNSTGLGSSAKTLALLASSGTDLHAMWIEDEMVDPAKSQYLSSPDTASGSTPWAPATAVGPGGTSVYRAGFSGAAGKVYAALIVDTQGGAFNVWDGSWGTPVNIGGTGFLYYVRLLALPPDGGGPSPARVFLAYADGPDSGGADSVTVCELTISTSASCVPSAKAIVATSADAILDLDLVRYGAEGVLVGYVFNDADGTRAVAQTVDFSQEPPDVELLGEFHDTGALWDPPSLSRVAYDEDSGKFYAATAQSSNGEAMETEILVHEYAGAQTWTRIDTGAPSAGMNMDSNSEVDAGGFDLEVLNGTLYVTWDEAAKIHVFAYDNTPGDWTELLPNGTSSGMGIAAEDGQLPTMLGLGSHLYVTWIDASNTVRVSRAERDTGRLGSLGQGAGLAGAGVTGSGSSGGPAANSRP